MNTLKQFLKSFCNAIKNRNINDLILLRESPNIRLSDGVELRIITSISPDPNGEKTRSLSLPTSLEKSITEFEEALEGLVNQLKNQTYNGPVSNDGCDQIISDIIGDKLLKQFPLLGNIFTKNNSVFVWAVHNKQNELLEKIIATTDTSPIESQQAAIKNFLSGDKWGRTLAHHAAQVHNIEALQILMDQIDKLIDVNDKDKIIALLFTFDEVDHKIPLNTVVDMLRYKPPKCKFAIAEQLLAQLDKLTNDALRDNVIKQLFTFRNIGYSQDTLFYNLLGSSCFKKINDNDRIIQLLLNQVNKVSDQDIRNEIINTLFSEPHSDSRSSLFYAAEAGNSEIVSALLSHLNSLKNDSTRVTIIKRLTDVSKVMNWHPVSKVIIDLSDTEILKRWFNQVDKISDKSVRDEIVKSFLSPDFEGNTPLDYVKKQNNAEVMMSALQNLLNCDDLTRDPLQRQLCQAIGVLGSNTTSDTVLLNQSPNEQFVASHLPSHINERQ